MAKIIIDDEALDRACENISHSIQNELLAAVIAELKKKRETENPRPEFLKKMIVKKTNSNGNQKRG